MTELLCQLSSVGTGLEANPSDSELGPELLLVRGDALVAAREADRRVVEMCRSGKRERVAVAFDGRRGWRPTRLVALRRK